MPKMKVGLVGCGNIGADLSNAVFRNTVEAQIVALTDVDADRAESMRRSFQFDAKVCDLDENARLSDFVVECAAPDAVAPVVEAAIRHRRDCLILSVGGLMEHWHLMEEARASGVEIRLPSGALCGLDGIRSGMMAGLNNMPGLHTVVLTTRKPPKGLEGAPYLVEKNIDLSGLDKPTVVFEGTAREACKAFPKNVNVAASLSFAGIGPDETRVRVIADPAATVNSHEVFAEGAFGKLRAVTENLPSPRNPKSSYLASLSAVAELKAAAEAFQMHQ
jgi:aspartate dehydrogenase